MALRDVSLEVPRGQFCVILGSSGAGKSTLLRAINGLVTLTSGSVEVDASDHVRRLAADPWQGHQILDGDGHFAPEALDEGHGQPSLDGWQ